MEEIWRPVVGYEGLYEVSDCGNVRNTRSGKLLSQQEQSGYKRVSLYKDGIVKKHLVHRLVAGAFIPNPNNYPVINHKDCNKSNNVVSNIEWCSTLYNNTFPPTKEQRLKTIMENGKKRKPVVKIDPSTNSEVDHYISESECARINNISRGNLSMVLNGYYGRKTLGGFIYAYA